MDQVAESPDSTCAQVIRPNIDNKKVQISAAREGQAQKQLGIYGRYTFCPCSFPFVNLI